MDVFLSIDIGSYSTKTAYAYKFGDSYRYGMLNIDGGIDFWSIACYNPDTCKWTFGKNDMLRSAKTSFRYIVHIKELLELFKDGTISLYRRKKLFKNFYFPPKETNSSYEETVKNGDYFQAKQTPRKVVELFLEHYCSAIKKEALARLKSDGIDIDTLPVRLLPIVLYPCNSSLDFICELQSLVANAFGCDAEKVRVISSTKAVAVSAKEFGVVDTSVEKALIFNIGEAKTSVVKVAFQEKNISAYGADGHLPPDSIGGKDFDYALYDALMSHSRNIPSFGSTDASDQGERGSYYEQFRMMSNIGYCKRFFGYEPNGQSNGVEFKIEREMSVPVSITSGEFQAIATPVYEKIWDYVKKELNNRVAGKKVNSDVDAVLFAGGASDTYGLDKFVEEKLKQYNKNIRFLDFSPATDGGPDFVLCPSTDTAPVGAVLFAVGKYPFEIITTRSYGTWGSLEKNGNDPCLYYAPIIRYGKRIPLQGKPLEFEKSESFKISRCRYDFEKQICYNYDEYYSLAIDDSQSEDVEHGPAIARKIGEEVDDDALMRENKYSSFERKNAISNYELKVLTEGFRMVFENVNPKMLRERNGFYFFDGKLDIRQGLKIDCEGRAIPFAESNGKDGPLGDIEITFRADEGKDKEIKIN